MLTLTDITKRYGSFTAVDSLSFTTERGKTYGLIGPNGAGKSTTIRMIMNILAPDSGSITLDGEVFSAKDRNRIGYLPEERGLYKKQKLNDVLLYLAALKGCGPKKAQGEIDRWLTRFGLIEWKDKKIDSLSKGMSQKVQFVSTVVHDPEIVFLDEPFSGLDPVSADELSLCIRELKESGKLVLFSTHVMEHAEKICDHIVMLNHGKKILDGSLRTIREEHGVNTVSLRFSVPLADARAFVETRPCVHSVIEDGDALLVTLHEGCQSGDLFTSLSSGPGVRSFMVNEPSLHSLFVSLVQTDGGAL